MKSHHIALALVAVASLSALGLKVGQTPAEQMQTFASAYLETLDENQREITLEKFDSPERVGWHFIPKDERKGLLLGQMNDAQRTAALRLLRSALSEAGYFKANRIMLLEEVLNEMEAGKGRWERNPQRYYVTLFGNPGASGENAESNRWGLSFEGHHLSLNFVCRGNEVVDSTPQFLAANPATIMNETSVTLGKGTAVLSREEQLGFKLINAMESSQQGKALVAEEAPAEIRFAGEPQATVGEPEGIAYSDLDAAQQSVLKELVFLYTDIAPEAVAKGRREQIAADGWDQVRFAWAGATKPGIGHYYRVQGKRFLIEFVNTQADPAGNPANHIHSVYRDLSGDFDLPIQ
ncbi:DUF3500 domain-containing protein [Neorhodopirellula pilleata]|nr:DUF3500 domain-containing protein [Neorhodopirellula pilleata]